MELHPSTFEDWRLVLLTGWGATGIALALGAALAVLALSLWGMRLEQRRGVWTILLCTRVLSLAAVVAVTLQPAVQLRSVSRLPNQVALLVDCSRSMSIREGPGMASRLESALALLSASHRRLESWRQRRVVARYGFGASLRPLPESPEAGDEATRIQEAVASLLGRTGARDLAGLVLMSDGADNASLAEGGLPPGASAFFKGLGVPVHTVLTGSRTLKDISVAEVYVDHFAFVRNAVRVEAEIAVAGMDPGEVTVTLENAGTVVAQQTLSLKKGEGRHRARLEFVPQEVGKFVYTVRVPSLEGDALAENNSRSFVLRVIRDRIRVLQLCGSPSWDERFLRQLLKRDPNVDLISFFILRTPTDLTAVDSSQLSLIPFPTDELFSKELGGFDLVVLQNFNYGPYGIGGYLPHIRQYVEQGGGLVMVGGELSFSSGGYAGSVLEPVLPVRLLPDEGDPGKLLSVEDFRPRVTPEGGDHPVLQLAESKQASLQVLGALPPLAGANLVRGPAPGATVLLAHPTLRAASGGAMPVLAAVEAGKGRSLAFTSDTSWHWAFLPVGRGGGRGAYDRFWRNAIRWLIRDPELKHLRVIAQQDRVRPGSLIKAVVRAYNPDYSPAAGVEVEHEITPLAAGMEEDPPGKGRAAPAGQAGKGTTDRQGELTLEFAPKQGGPYLLRARATLGGRLTSEDAVVLVEHAGPEIRDPAARPALLQQIAAATGGQYLGRATSLPDLPFSEPRVLQVNWRKDVELWSRPWSFAALLLLLGVDWFLRRKFGYL